MLNYDTNTAILFIMPSLEETARESFSQICRIKPKRLYVAHDYPLDSADIDEMQKIRSLTSLVDWDCELHTRFVTEPQGYNKLMFETVTWFFDHEPEGIIIEGGYMPSNSFFGFCSTLLEKYRNNPFIGHISAGELKPVTPPGKASYYFSALSPVYAWAGWRRVWNDVKKRHYNYSFVKRTKILDLIPSIKPFKPKWEIMLERGLSKDIRSDWAGKYAFSNLVNNRLSIIPTCQLVDYVRIKTKAECKLKEIEKISAPELMICDVDSDIKQQEILFSMPVFTKNEPDGFSYIKNRLIDFTEGKPFKMKIPKIIHQIYESPDGPSKNLLNLSKSWKTLNPDWEYRFWDKKAMDDFMTEHYPEFIPIFQSFPFNVQRWDAIRYLILYKIGGLYVDFDYECLEPIDSLLLNTTCCMGMEPSINAAKHHKKQLLGNAFMASVPGHPYLKKLIDDLKKNHDKQWSDNDALQIMNTTGPFFTTRIYKEMKRKSTVTLLSADLVAPLSLDEVRLLYDGRMTDGMVEKIKNSFAIHYFLGSWIKQTRKFKKEQGDK